MTLLELEAVLVARVDASSHREVDELAEADGVRFLCPICYRANGGPVGTHLILCWGPSVPREDRPGPGRWTMAGTGLEDLTLAPSVHLTGPGCGAHFFVRSGTIAG